MSLEKLTITVTPEMRKIMNLLKEYGFARTDEEIVAQALVHYLSYLRDHLELLRRLREKQRTSEALKK